MVKQINLENREETVRVDLSTIEKIIKRKIENNAFSNSILDLSYLETASEHVETENDKYENKKFVIDKKTESELKDCDKNELDRLNGICFMMHLIIDDWLDGKICHLNIDKLNESYIKICKKINKIEPCYIGPIWSKQL